MKRLISILIVLILLFGCGQKVIAPSTMSESTTASPTATVTPTAVPTAAPTASPVSTSTPPPVLATFSPQRSPKACFAEELLSQDGEPIDSEIRALLGSESLSKDEFHDRFCTIIRLVDDLAQSLLELVNQGRTLSADRKAQTVNVLMALMGPAMLDTLQNAYDKCSGTGEELPLSAYSSSMDALLRSIQESEERTVPFFGLGSEVAKEYKTVLDRYMGERVVPRTLFTALEELAQTEAYAINTALKADPEAGRKKEPISFGSFAENMAFLCKVAEELCPLPDDSRLIVPKVTEAEAQMDLLELAFRWYPGMAYLKAYADRSSEAQKTRWANAPDGYLAGLAVHCSYAVVPYLTEFGLDYVQYRWYEDMLDVTLTGIVALLIHYYGYSTADLAAYLKGWGAEDFVGYLYDRAMSDPFESLVASYGYYQYLDICQAALDAGCENERRFLQDYLATGPAPFQELKEYMNNLYQNEG